MKKTLGIIGAIAMLAVVAYLLLLKPLPITNSASVYTNAEYGIRFNYPATYVIEEKEVGNAERRHYAITMIDREALANLPEAGEGPPVMSIDVYQNNLDKLPLDNWIRETNDSNFKLSDGRLTSVSVAGAQAYFYRWDGLYRGDSYAFVHKDNIVVFSVTYLKENDQIRKDFEEVLDSVELQ